MALVAFPPLGGESDIQEAWKISIKLQDLSIVRALYPSYASQRAAVTCTHTPCPPSSSLVYFKKWTFKHFWNVLSDVHCVTVIMHIDLYLNRLHIKCFPILISHIHPNITHWTFGSGQNNEKSCLPLTDRSKGVEECQGGLQQTGPVQDAVRLGCQVTTQQEELSKMLMPRPPNTCIKFCLKIESPKCRRVEVETFCFH